MEPRAESRINVLREKMNVLRYGVEGRETSQCFKIGNAYIMMGDECITIGISIR